MIGRSGIASQQETLNSRNLALTPDKTRQLQRKIAGKHNVQNYSPNLNYLALEFGVFSL
jgi:hypothetical protein